MRLRDRWLLHSTSLTTVKFVHLYSSIRTFFEQVGRKMFWSLLGYIVTKTCASPTNSTWFTRPFLLVRRWGSGDETSPHPTFSWYLLHYEYKTNSMNTSIVTYIKLPYGVQLWMLIRESLMVYISYEFKGRAKGTPTRQLGCILHWFQLWMDT